MARGRRFIRLRTDTEEHPSVVALRKTLLDENAFSYVLRLILYAARWFGTGIWPARYARGIEREAGWEGPQGALELALLDAGLIRKLPSGYIELVAWRICVFQLPGSWSTAAYPQVYERDQWTCRYCGATEESAELSIDHILPRLLGGSDHPENLAVACKSCNSRKGARTPEQAGMTLLPIPGSEAP